MLNGLLNIFFRKMFIQSICPFKIGLFVLFIEFYEFLIYLDIDPLSDMWFVNLFSYFIGCLFILLMVSFALQKLFSLMSARLFIFAFVFGVKSKNFF